MSVVLPLDGTRTSTNPEECGSHLPAKNQEKKISLENGFQTKVGIKN